VPTVATKLLVPPTPRHVIVRERLLDVLDDGGHGRVVLLSAPAGAGKTVLLSSWLRSRHAPPAYCWLSLDGDDNDVSRLLADLLSALRTSGVVAPESALDRLTPPPAAGARAGVGARAESFLALLVNGLSELESAVVVVLDELHELTSPGASATIDYLVRHAPEQCRLVLSGRADPVLPIERMRVSEQLTELRMADLAFTRAETAELCGALRLELSDADVQRLWRRTEGWPAALRLAALSLEGHAEPGRFVAELAGTDRAIADYLVSEVLTTMPADRRTFMLRTCLVEEVSPELADAVTGLDGGAAMLAALEHSGAFILPADPECRWYRYHPLFAELLRAHLRHVHAEEVSLLHGRAARWYAENGLVMQAIRHALAGADWEHAGRLIAENWLDLFVRGESAAMRGPIAGLPAAVVDADPQLAASLAGSRLEDGDLEVADAHLATARAAVERRSGPPSKRLRMTLAAVSLHRARLRGDAGEAERCAHELVELAPHGSALHSFALAGLGATRLWCGEHDTAAGCLEQAVALATEYEHDHVAVDCLGQLAIVHLLRGELTRAGETSATAVELAERGGWADSPSAACAYLAAATAAYHRGEFESAEGRLTHAAAAADTAEASVGVAVGAMQALTMAAAGPRSAGRGALKLRAIRAALRESPTLPRFLRVAFESAKVHVLLAAGEPERARAWLADARSLLPDSAELLACQAAIELHDGELEQAATDLALVLGEAPADTDGDRSSPGADPASSRPVYGAQAPGEPLHPAALVEAWLLQALVHQADGAERSAGLALDRALAAAEREPYRNAFLTSGPGVGELLERQARTGTEHPALLEVLLDGVDHAPPAAAAALAEPLTEREQRILRYLPTMLSNAEIGAEMFVSLNTVKTHLRSIYRKLNAGGRADAVERARRLGLLPSGIRRPHVARRPHAARRGAGR